MCDLHTRGAIDVKKAHFQLINIVISLCFCHQSIRKASLVCNNVLSEEGLAALYENKRNTLLRSCLPSRDELLQPRHLLHVKTRLGGVYALQRGTARHWGLSWTLDS